ncbi:MAG: hypothetical protein A2Y33_12185 [Spirochaetes bacterium GWF1_51_8]|nr:MAG: hypothetical protein A2Y33_12185 [Spirochaetes bacterium GWF1_51_8]
MNILKLDPSNIASEHICCAFSDKKVAAGYEAKKALLADGFPRGFVFKKLNVKHKVFIEYAPDEAAWLPVDAPGYLGIHCFWVAGQYKGQGHGKALMDECIQDASGTNGVYAITSAKKRPFFTDKAFFLKNGFETCDTAPPYFELMVRRNGNAPLPKFRDNARRAECPQKDGIAVYYTNRCPFTEYYTDELEAVVRAKGLNFQRVKVSSVREAKDIPSAASIYSIFYNGKFVTHEIQTSGRFEKLWAGMDK